MGNKYLYRMWNADFFTLRNTDNNKKPFVFKTKDGPRDSFKIEELDFITSRYSSFDDFYSALEKFGDKYVDGHDKNISITHNYNGKLYFDDLILNDKLVEKVASQVINKENKKDNLPIPNSNSLSYFISYIEDIATSNEYKYLLHSEEIRDISAHDYNVLYSCIKKDIVIDGKKVNPGIHSLLCEYREVHQKNRECIDRGSQNDYEGAELDRIRKEINSCVRGSYKVFRDLVVWENRYEKVLTKKFVDEKDLSKKLQLYRLIADINMEKELRENKIDNGDMYDYYTMYRKKITITNDGTISLGDIDDQKISTSINKQIDKINTIGRK